MNAPQNDADLIIRRVAEAARQITENPGTAKEVLQETSSEVRALPDTQGRVEALITLTRAALGAYDSVSAYGLAREALETARRIGWRRGEAEALQMLAVSPLYIGECSQAVPILQEALALALKLDDQLLVLRALANLGATLISEGHYQEAIKATGQALSVAESLPGAPQALQIRNNLVWSYCRWALQLRAQGEEAQADECLQQAARLMPPVDHCLEQSSEALTVVCDTRLTLALAMGRDDQVAEDLANLLRCARVHRSAAARAFALDHLASWRERQGRLRAAVGLSRKVVALTRRIPIHQRMMQGLESLCRRHAAVGDFEQAYRVSETIREEEKRLNHNQAKSRAAMAGLAWEIEKERERARTMLVHAGKMVAVGRMASGVIHEMSHPVNALSLLAQTGVQLAAREDLAGLSTLQPKIGREAARLHSLIRRLRSFSRSAPPQLASRSLAAIIDDARHLYLPRLTLEGIEYDEEVEEAEVYVDAERLSLAIANVVLNAADAMAGQAQRRVTLRAHRCSDRVCIVIRDRGPGLSAEAQAHLFEPFFTTKPEGQGLGLALSAESLASMHARLDGANHPDGGAMFTITMLASAAGL